MSVNSVKRQLSLMTAIEIPFRRDVFRERNRFIAAQAGHFEQTGALSDRLYEEHIRQITDIFERYHKRAFVFFTSEAAQQLKAKEKKTALWESSLRKYTEKYGARRAKEVAGTTQDDIRRVLSSAYNADEPETNYTRRILAARGLSPFRAFTIARTETHAAAMYASTETVKEIQTDTGLDVLKIWNTTEDDRTREAHAAADGQRVKMSEQFEVGGEMMDMPGDQSASAENNINCRCVLTYEPL